MVTHRPTPHSTVLDANLIYAAGDGGLFLKSTNGGATWSQEPTGYGAALFNVACKSRTQCFATGQSGEVFAFDDQPWALQAITPARAHAVNALSNGTSYTGACPERSRRDANGNMLTRGAQTLTWDAENRLASVVSDTTTTTFAGACPERQRRNAKPPASLSSSTRPPTPSSRRPDSETTPGGVAPAARSGQDIAAE